MVSAITTRQSSVPVGHSLRGLVTAGLAIGHAAAQAIEMQQREADCTLWMEHVGLAKRNITVAQIFEDDWAFVGYLGALGDKVDQYCYNEIDEDFDNPDPKAKENCNRARVNLSVVMQGVMKVIGRFFQAEKSYEMAMAERPSHC